MFMGQFTNKKLDTVLNRTFKYAKQIAKEFYFKEWAPNPPKCPAFDIEKLLISVIMGGNILPTRNQEQGWIF